MCQTLNLGTYPPQQVRACPETETLSICLRRSVILEVVSSSSQDRDTGPRTTSLTNRPRKDCNIGMYRGLPMSQFLAALDLNSL